ASAALGVAEPRQVHGEYAVVPGEDAGDAVPGVARLEEAADQHDRRAVRAEALVVREYPACLDEPPGRRQRAPALLVSGGCDVVDRRAARHTERDGERSDPHPLR